jgi:hypothetical protein
LGIRRFVREEGRRKDCQKIDTFVRMRGGCLNKEINEETDRKQKNKRREHDHGIWED